MVCIPWSWNDQNPYLLVISSYSLLKDVVSFGTSQTPSCVLVPCRRARCASAAAGLAHSCPLSLRYSFLSAVPVAGGGLGRSGAGRVGLRPPHRALHHCERLAIAHGGPVRHISHLERDGACKLLPCMLPVSAANSVVQLGQ